MLIQNLINNSKQSSGLKSARFLDSTTPLFSQFGRNIYASDVVQTCIDRIATECSKLQPRHIRKDNAGKIINLSGDNLNRIFKFAPNELMSTRDFIEKVIWLLYLNYNAFIYPTYEIYYDARGNQQTNYTGFYPLNPTQVEFLQDQANKLFARMTFGSGQQYTLAYSDLIHLRKKFSVNDVMGGGLNGQPDNSALLKTLEINDTMLQGIGKAIKASFSIRGIIKIATLMDDDKQKAERAAFEQKMADNESGILPVDLKGDFTPITIDPKLIDSTTLEFVEKKILRWYGVSLPILNNDFSDDQYQAFYNSTLEPIVIGLGQSFSGCLFTPTEQSYNNEIVFYNRRLELMDVKNKLAILDGLGNRGALTNNELLALFGIEPYEGGDRRFVSLNYIDADIANEYQLARAGIDSQTPNGTGGNNGNGQKK
ncbi:phage portal protein [Desulfosporosinus sp. PR]|uniref:phage portal protein n=1 Tax=Candidatus Desulfosporosinus nitrosoreducens TaxID=3401928 RepID=UPI0027F9675F|nr:phage portal protein [Desulfosporosinus sp. PR]MDQ7095951.1 phage portal protein [Desulfosporosinus sp. PR]